MIEEDEDAVGEHRLDVDNRPRVVSNGAMTRSWLACCPSHVLSPPREHNTAGASAVMVQSADRAID